MWKNDVSVLCIINVYWLIAGILNVKNRQLYYGRCHDGILCYNALDVTLGYRVIMCYMSRWDIVLYYVRCHAEILCYNVLDVALGYSVILR